jgi:hypothetical protein
VDKVAGMELSSEDYGTAEKQNLDQLRTGSNTGDNATNAIQ